MIVDTFSGFASDQFDEDVSLGTPESFRTHFALNPLVLVERTMRYYGLSEVTVVQDDIVTMGEHQLPERIKVCLMDVDRTDADGSGIRKIWQRLEPGGVIFVDHCDAATAGGALDRDTRSGSAPTRGWRSVTTQVSECW